ncbi:hypothetical protein [Luteibacter sp. RCC_6_2]|uniref:hypothetical protein n=1 Tax=Luteibacter sp. RCC_6_2 TaxID=3239223 RepID=UPI0035232B3D
MHLDDFVTEDGIACIRVSADGEGQSLKTDASARAVPVHRKLLERGLVDYAEIMLRHREA